MMIASFAIAVDRKLEVIKSSSSSFDCLFCADPISPSVRSFGRKQQRLHLIPDSVQFPSTPLPPLYPAPSRSLRMLVSPAAIGIYGYGL